MTAARLWGGSLSVALALHLGLGGAALLWMQKPISDLPAGAFAVELASFGGAPGLAKGGAPAPAPPPATPQPEPEPEAVKPLPQPVVPEVALPAPKPKPKPKPKPEPKAVHKPAPKPPERPAEAPSSAPTAQEAVPAPPSTAALAGSGGTAAGSAEGSAGSPIVGQLGAGGSSAGTPLGRYKAVVYHTLWKNRRYPAVAQRMGYQGDVEVMFTIAADGDVRDVRVVRESGHGVLDREVAAMLDRVRRFPPIPHEIAAPALTFRIVIPFRLS